ncbi:MAG: hypothetical protein CVU57_26600 [Deltaproteobacteria bacterium HGW-Deltaproteobacteria-15]|jgi:F1F0 ATPase subunit 2|nr:MAG: hypothetical protein CVU57_26600 [Deltaproteobacteria bacterium HGW-Deltaproteobacteria-15]
MDELMSFFNAFFISMVPAFAAGIGTGAFYFGGLWLTVQRLGKERNAGLLLTASFLLRASLSCVVFFLFMKTGLADLLACMLGFFLVRLFWIHRLRPTPVGPARAGKAD